MIARLIDALGRRIREDLAGFLLEHPEAETLTEPPVYVGGLPDGLGGEEAFPCVVVSWEEAEDTEEEAEVSVEITLCMSSHRGPQGLEQWTATFTDRLRSILREARVLDNEFERQWPVRTRRPDPRKEQHRYAVVVLATTWRRPAPRQIVEGFEI